MEGDARDGVCVCDVFLWEARPAQRFFLETVWWWLVGVWGNVVVVVELAPERQKSKLNAIVENAVVENAVVNDKHDKLLV